MARTLSHAEARRYYDRFGGRQDGESWYEDASLAVLTGHGRLARARSVLEFGCGTGRFAERLVRHHLPPDATYLGLDVSGTMVGLARDRLRDAAPRVTFHRTDGGVVFPVGDASVDRVVCTYVLDLLSDADIAAFLDESRRVLTPRGRLLVACVTRGRSGLARLASGLWSLAHRLRPTLVGGCRPLALGHRLAAAGWTIGHRELVRTRTVTSEAVVAVADPAAVAPADGRFMVKQA